MPESRTFGDVNNVVPLCGGCHRSAPDSYHNARRAFEEWAGGKHVIAAVAVVYSSQFLDPEGFYGLTGKGGLLP